MPPASRRATAPDLFAAHYLPPSGTGTAGRTGREIRDIKGQPALRRRGPVRCDRRRNTLQPPPSLGCVAVTEPHNAQIRPLAASHWRTILALIRLPEPFRPHGVLRVLRLALHQQPVDVSCHP